MEKSETVLNFYVEANSNKYDICDDRTFRGISVAEKTVLECIVAMGITTSCKGECGAFCCIKGGLFKRRSGSLGEFVKKCSLLC